jgi:hypothetical protein
MICKTLKIIIMADKSKSHEMTKSKEKSSGGKEDMNMKHGNSSHSSSNMSNDKSSRMNSDKNMNKGNKSGSH